MTLENAIQEIIANSFSKNDLFDSHTVINELVKNPEYHFAYMNEYPKGTPIKTYHSNISKMIKCMSCIESTTQKVKTHTIYGTLSDNEVWKKN